DRTPRPMRRAHRGRAGTASGCRRHDPFGLYPRPGPKPRRDLQLLTADRARSFVGRGGEDQAQLAERPAGLGGPGVEARLNRGAVLAVFWRGIDRTPMLECRSDRISQDEGVLADHAQKTRAGIAAHLAAALGERLPQLDDVGPRPVGEPGAKAAVLLGDPEHRSGIVADRF